MRRVAPKFCSSVVVRADRANSTGWKNVKENKTWNKHYPKLSGQCGIGGQHLPGRGLFTTQNYNPYVNNNEDCKFAFLKVI